MGERILVVDDDPILSEAAKLFLTQAGYEVRLSASGQAALIDLHENAVDLVLMDIRMPGLDGVETLRRLRKAGYAMPVVMMTVDNRAEVIRDVLALGGNGYLLKPFGATEIVTRVRKALDAARTVSR
jgi:DNA-binding response OmpR family regulator